MVSALSGPSVCPAASSAFVFRRFNATGCCAANGDELVTRAREKMASFSGGSVACVVFARSEHAHLRSFGAPTRVLRRAGVALPRPLLWKPNRVRELAETGRREASCFAAAGKGGTQVDNAAEGRSSESENRIEEDGSRSSMGEDIDSLGKMAECATEKLLENLDTGARTAQTEETGARDAGFWRRVGTASDAGAVLAMIAERAGGSGGVASSEECSKLIVGALAQGNSELAFSVLKAMRGSVVGRRIEGDEKGSLVEGWRWAQPNVSTYATLVRGLAASLRVADAIGLVADVRRRGVPAGDEIPCGKVSSCPTYKTALAVVHSQQGVQPGGLFPNYLTKPLATGTTLGPKFAFLNRRGIGPFLSGERAAFCCKSVINSGSPAGTTSDDKTPDPKEDGSILTGDGSELRNTVRLVECAMLAATAGLAYFLSNLLRIEGYFGCFFPLPVVISSMRWGASAGRKTMVATTMLLLILSGPLKAASYLLMHGFVGLAMGAFWKWNLNWGLSIAACTVVRCLGALGFVLLTSWLLRDNLLALITMNAHASLSYMLAALGINLVPTMPMIYVVFASLLVVNCGSFVFLLHVLYAIFLRRLGLRGSITVPGWVERAM